MRVLLLDWSGTLSTLDDPVAFVEKLKAQGDYCILMSGHFAGTIDKECPGLVDACHRYKGRTALAEIVRDLTDTHPYYNNPDGPLEGITEIVVVDDNYWNIDSADDYSMLTKDRHGFTCRGLHASQIQELLR